MKVFKCNIRINQQCTLFCAVKPIIASKTQTLTGERHFLQPRHFPHKHFVRDVRVGHEGEGGQVGAVTTGPGVQGLRVEEAAVAQAEAGQVAAP